MKRFLVLALISALVILPATSSVAAASKPPKGAVQLDPDKIFVTGEGKNTFICGQVKGWESGKLVGKSKEYFLPLRAEMGLLKKKVQTAALQSKIAKLKKKQKLGKAACKNGPQNPVSPPNPTPVPPVATPDYLAEKTTPVTLEDLNHLYRRAGLGVPPNAALAFVGGPVGPLVDYFTTYSDESALEAEARTWLDENPQEPNFPQNQATVNGITMYALQILMKTSNQFHERLAFFGLHDRIATSSSAVAAIGSQRGLMVQHLALLRQAAQSDLNYAQLLENIGEDGVMVKWLTLDRNLATAPNENYARELMELFSLDSVDSAGNPNYTNDDIINISRAFTGWNLLQVNGEWRVIFTPATFDPDAAKVIFSGTAYQGTVQTSRDVVRHIFAAHPNAPMSLAKWIAREYIKEGTPDTILSQLGAMIKENNFVLKPVLVKLLKSEEFYKPENQFVIAKTAVERMVHLTRIMDKVQMPYSFQAVKTGLDGMGCIVTQPDTVFGCDKLEELPDGQRLLNSANLITALSNNNNLFTSSNWTYNQFFPNAAPTADQLIDHMEALFGLKLAIARKAAIRDYMNSAMNNNGTLVVEAWNPANAQMVRRKTAGLFRIFAGIPQIHDLR